MEELIEGAVKLGSGTLDTPIKRLLGSASMDVEALHEDLGKRSGDLPGWVKKIDAIDAVPVLSQMSHVPLIFRAEMRRILFATERANNKVKLDALTIP